MVRPRTTDESSMSRGYVSLTYTTSAPVPPRGGPKHKSPRRSKALPTGPLRRGTSTLVHAGRVWATTDVEGDLQYARDGGLPAVRQNGASLWQSTVSGTMTNYNRGSP